MIENRKKRITNDFKEYRKTKFLFSTILLIHKNFEVQLHDQQEIRCIGVLYLKILKMQVFVVPNLQELLDRHFHVNSKNLNENNPYYEDYLVKYLC